MEKRSVLIQNYNLSQVQNSQIITQQSDKDREKSKSIINYKKKSNFKTNDNHINSEILINEEYKNNNSSESLNSSPNKLNEKSQESINFEFLRNHNLKQFNIPLKLYFNKY